MKRLLLLILLVAGLAGCNGGPEPKPDIDYPWEVYVREVQAFSGWFGEDRDFWFSLGSVTSTGQCQFEHPPETWENMAFSTSTTGLWTRSSTKEGLTVQCFYASESEGVWVLPEYEAQNVFVAWEENP